MATRSNPKTFASSGTRPGNVNCSSHVSASRHRIVRFRDRAPRITVYDIIVWAAFTAFIAALILAVCAATWLVI